MARFHLALAMVDGVGPIAAGRILAAFPDAAGAFGADHVRLRQLGLSDRQARAVAAFNDFTAVDRVMERALELGQQVLAIDDPRYPASLRTIDDPPPALFVKGNLDSRLAVAATVVGTRQPTPYGEKVALHLGAALARNDVVTVSGGARGIDARSHEGALNAGGVTIAVLGCGLDVPYPVAHGPLFERIVGAGGALVGELPPGTRPDKGTFPRRNRIVAALGRVCVVVEAGVRSGALITARLAAEQGKTVLGVPGPIDRAQSRGVNGLIRDGARPLLEIEDVVDEVLGEHHRRVPVEADLWSRVRPVKAAPPGDAGTIWDALVERAADTDSLVARTGLEVARVNAALVELEVMGRVERRPGNMFVAKVEE